VRSNCESIYTAAVNQIVYRMKIVQWNSFNRTFRCLFFDFYMQLTPELIIGSLIGLFTSFLWAISTIVYKSQSKEETPLAISSLKMWAALAFMSIIVILRFRTTPFYMPFENIIYLITSVSIGLVAGDVVYLTSQERIGVSYAFPIANIYPILTYIVAIFLVNEIIVISRLIGIIVAVTGVTLISREQAEKNKREGITKFDAIGISLAFLAALSWAFGTVFLQIGVTGIDPIDANFIRMLFGSIIFVPIFLGSIKRGMHVPSRRSTKIIIAAGFLGMTVGSLLYTYTVKLIGAPISALLGSTSPLFAVPISIIFLKEKFSLRSIIGALLTVVGVILVIVAF
jgi:DME family drug/metabolite transporter